MSELCEPPAIARRLSEFATNPALRALCRTLVGGHYERVRVGLPRLVDPAKAAHFFRGPDVLLELGYGPSDGPHALGVVLSSASAAALVDRLLGGPGANMPPGALRDAECGVLAYGAARVLTAVAPHVALIDVRNEPQQALIERAANHILWPLLLDGQAPPLELRVLLSRAAARALPFTFTLELSLFDSVVVSALDDLTDGAVLVSDTWDLTVTSRGLSGGVHVFVPDANARFLAALEGGVVYLPAGNSHDEPDAGQLRVTLAHRDVGLDELAMVASGAAPAFSNVAPREVLLTHGGRPLGRGELASHHGSVCVRLTRCDSAASPEPRPA